MYELSSSLRPGLESKGLSCGSGLAAESQGLALLALVLNVATPPRGTEAGGTQREVGREKLYSMPGG